jgi:uncharacterized protein (DUF362 family)
MRAIDRRAFLAASAQGLVALSLRGAPAEKARIGLVASSHSKLAKPSSLEDPLDYPRVRDMVWKAIEYGRPRAGSLEAKIKPGSWVVIKPNIGSLPPRKSNFTLGDITDMRVTRAVFEYVATKSRAARVTIAEGGSYRRIGDNTPDGVMLQNGVHVDALTYSWGDEYPGFKGTLGDMLKEASSSFPGKKFDYVDLAYDAVRDPSGEFRWMDVPRSPNGVGAFGEKKVYVPANAIINCDFLITVPVMKVHNQCGMTGCFKTTSERARASSTRRRELSRITICIAIIRSKAGSIRSSPIWRRFIPRTIVWWMSSAGCNTPNTPTAFPIR